MVAIDSGFNNVASDNRDLRTIAENAYNIGEFASVDAIALLACSFRLALDALSLKEADVYLDALRWSVRRILTRWDAHHLVGQALATLIEVRLLRRPSGPVSPELLGFRTRRDRRHAELHAVPIYTSHHMLQRCEASYASPIVLRDGEMQRFFDDFQEDYQVLRNQILERLSEGDADQAWIETISEICQQRQDLIDDIFLGNLNTSDEDAVEMLRHISIFRALGGLEGILDEFFNPNP